jgi:hypothetical protein
MIIQHHKSKKSGASVFLRLTKEETTALMLSLLNQVQARSPNVGREEWLEAIWENCNSGKKARCYFSAFVTNDPLVPPSGLTPLGFTKNGIPVLSPEDKAEAIKQCVKTGSWEDILGHCADLMKFYAEEHSRPLRKLKKLLSDDRPVACAKPISEQD